jgi:hypothetical protein
MIASLISNPHDKQATPLGRIGFEVPTIFGDVNWLLNVSDLAESNFQHLLNFRLLGHPKVTT